MILTIPTKDNIGQIQILYKKNRDALGIPFGRVFDAMIDNPNFVVCTMDDGTVVGFCGVHYRPRLGYFEIEHLCVDIYHRKQHLATTMLRDLINSHKSQDVPFCALAIEGMPNNAFCDKISKGYERVPRKHCILRRYEIDIDKVTE